MWQNFMIFGIRGIVTDLIMHAKYLVNQFRHLRSCDTHKYHFTQACCTALTTVSATDMYQCDNTAGASGQHLRSRSTSTLLVLST